ncbi:MAG TPA: hypothetical protein VHB77_05785 [Planctomycetaceae bacterium]|nr:hypothetical protein [Planctomycetaceae bacterium]
MRTRIWLAATLLFLGTASAQGDDAPATDVDNPHERILLCTPQGPIIVQLSLMYEGRPYRHEVERIVDEQFAMIADNPTWSAALANRQFLGGRFSFANRRGTRETMIARHDRDADRKISRDELRSALLNDTAGETVRIAEGAEESNENDELFALIDVDGDWQFSADELRQAAARVARADYTQDGALLPFELQRAVPRSRRPSLPLAVLLGRKSSPGDAISLLLAHYADPLGDIPRVAFQIAPALFDRLDTNGDGKLRNSELPLIDTLAAQITIAIDHDGSKARQPMLFQLKETSPELAARLNENESGRLQSRFDHGEGTVEVRGLSLGTKDQNFTSAQRLMRQLDRDMNGYLDATEAQVAQRLGRTMIADLDGDGKILREEIETAFEREAIFSRCWIEIGVLRQPVALWNRLDTNRDQQLGERELLALPQVLAKFDTDGDGNVAYHEMPFRLEVQICRGSRGARGAFSGPLLTRTRTTRNGIRIAVGPAWFQHMDRNNDGDVSRREFLGTLEQFDRIDADHDGLIDSKEAESAKPRTSSPPPEANTGRGPG